MSIFIAFGANLFNPPDAPFSEKAKRFAMAFELLRKKGVEIEAVSSFWASPSWPPGQGHPDFLNGVVKAEFKGRADELLAILNETEAKMGRARSVRNAPRLLDLDIIDFKGQLWETDRLTLPHPRMADRAFVLFPLMEIAPDWRHPVSGAHIEKLLGALGPEQLDGFKLALRAKHWALT